MAAHLALVSVAPLFLFPFCSESMVAQVVLWLSLFAAAWTLMEPSTHGGESLHQARRRVLASVVRDPVFYLALALVVFGGLRALNGGVRMAYDIASSDWSLAGASVSEFPGCVDGAGFLPFAGAVALAVVLTAVRQALGRAARMLYFFAASALAGLAAVVALVAAAHGHAGCARLFAVPNAAASYFGVACGLYFLAGVAALATVFERSWAFAKALLPLSIGGTALGAFAFAPPASAAAFAAAGLLVFLLTFVYARKVLRSPGEYRMLVVFAVSLTLGGLLAMFLMPEAAMSARLEAFAAGAFVPERFLEIRATLSEIALRTWKTAPWIGTGLGSFPLDVRFQATPEDWSSIPRGVVAVANGGWLVLAERGIVGAACLALPLGFLLFTYARRLVLWARAIRLPHPSSFLAPLVVVLLALCIPFDASFLRPDAFLAAAAILAVSAKSFPNPEMTSHV